MTLYIDPGTGSMLFAILIGVLGALHYALRNLIVKLRFILNGGKKVVIDQDSIPLVIFSDDKRYWTVFEPVCRELDRRGIEVTYMTSSEDDPVLKCPYEHIHGEFIGKGNKAYARLNFLHATILLSTTPGLDVYQWKRSKDVKCYIHMLHAPNEVVGYRMFGTDYYDVLLLSGDYQERDIRQLEQLRGLPNKEIFRNGIPYMDEVVKRLKEAPELEKRQEVTVLLAPSWGTSAILSRFGGKIIEALLNTGYHIIIRPHPQSFVSEKELMEDIMKRYPDSNRLEWNRDNDNFEVLRRADIMISDFSGVIFDFALVYDKPIIYADTDYDNAPYDAWWLDHPAWTFTVLPRIGVMLTSKNIGSVKELIDTCLSESKYAEARQEAREETWEYQGEGAKRTADYLIEKYKQLNQAD